MAHWRESISCLWSIWVLVHVPRNLRKLSRPTEIYFISSVDRAWWRLASGSVFFFSFSYSGRVFFWARVSVPKVRRRMNWITSIHSAGHASKTKTFISISSNVILIILTLHDTSPCRPMWNSNGNDIMAGWRTWAPCSNIKSSERYE